MSIEPTTIVAKPKPGTFRFEVDTLSGGSVYLPDDNGWSSLSKIGSWVADQEARNVKVRDILSEAVLGWESPDSAIRRIAALFAE